MNLLLLDDNREAIEFFKFTVKSIDINASVFAFDNADSFVEYLIENHQNIDCAFFDIQLKDLNGIDMAVTLHEKYSSIPIVFLTGYPEKYCQDIFLANADLKPFAFIIKPVDKNIVEKILNQLSQKQNKAKQSIIVKSADRSFVIDVDNIVYLESDRRQIIVHTITQTIRTYGKLKSLLNELPDYFLMPHNSFILNTKFISSFDNTVVSLNKCNTRIPISRGRKDDFTSKLLQLKGLNKC